MEQTQQFFTLKNEEATSDLARALSPLFEKGDVLLLHGDLGVGKTTFAKSFIRAFLGDDSLDVPSPTFTIVQHYYEGSKRLDHYDCYRLNDPEEALEIGVEESFEKAVTLIEWADRIESYLPSSFFILGLKIDEEHLDQRQAFIKGDDVKLKKISWPESVILKP